MVISHLTQRKRRSLRRHFLGKHPIRIYTLFRRLITFFMVALLWIFFRSDTVKLALMRIQTLFSFNRFFWAPNNSVLLRKEALLGQTPHFWLITLLAIAVVFVIEFLNRHAQNQDFLPGRRQVGEKLAESIQNLLEK